MNVEVGLDQTVNDFDRDGVVRVRNLFTQNEIETVRHEIKRYERDILPNLPETEKVFESDEKSVRNMWRLHQHDTYFDRLSKWPKLIDLAAKLVHGKPEVWSVQTFNKPAQLGSAVPYHQDNAYFCQSPPDIFTLWIAVDAATVKNGAVYYQIGTHEKMLAHKPSGIVGNSSGLADPPPQDPSEEFCGTLKPGDALAHHSQTIHRSEPNTSDQSRLSLLMVYRGLHTETDPRLKHAYENAAAKLSSQK